MAELLLKNLDDTRSLGNTLGRTACSGDVIFLKGDLGAGKTTLAQFIAEGLEVPDEYYVTSPSFALMHEYPGRISLYHIDCYRLEGEDDVEESGLMDYIVAAGLTLIEWPDRLGTLVPDKRLEIEIRVNEKNERVVKILPYGDAWQKRMAELIKACNPQANNNR